MDMEPLAIGLKELLDTTRTYLEESKQELGKYQMALSGTFRLLDGKSTILTKLQGNKDDLTSYLLQQTTQLTQNSAKRLETILERVTSLITLVSDGDRNS
ncbi:MAG: hypothetical protein ACTSUO_08970 [Candidatus Thorarchaeota archaeon]